MKKSSKKTGAKKNVRISRVMSISRPDLNYTLNLTEENLLSHGINIDDITKVEDLSFLKEKKDLWDQISLTSNNNLINTLLFLNKVQTNKTFVELTLLNNLKYADNEIFIKEILNHVTEHNYLFFNETDYDLKSEVKISFSIKCGKKVKTFNLCNGKQDTIEKPDFFSSVKIDFKEFNYFYIDINEFLSFEEKSYEVVEKFSNYIRSKALPFKNLKIIMNFPDMIKNFKNINLETLNLIENLLSYGDYFIFEKTEAGALFNMFHQIYNTQETHNEERSIETFMMNNVHYYRQGNKTIFILDEFQKFSVMQFCSRKKQIASSDYDFLLYPRINHFNQKLVEDYKKLLVVYHLMLKSVFLGGFLARVISSSDKNKEEFYAGFLVGTESVKRTLEILKNNLDLPSNDNFYLVKLVKSKILKEIETENLKRREQKFVLDCVNKTNSHLKFYNPLFDGHLNSYFASETIRKQLKDKGFINTNGFIMYDPSYKTAMGGSPRRQKSSDLDKEKQLLYNIKHFNLSDDSLDRSQFDTSKMQKCTSPTNRKLPSLQFEYYSGKNASYPLLKKKLKPLENDKKTEVANEPKVLESDLVSQK